MFARRKPPSYWDYSVNCTGNEVHLSSCNLGRLPSANSTCSQGIPVVVSCVPGRAFAPTPLSGYRKAFRHEVGFKRLYMDSSVSGFKPSLIWNLCLRKTELESRTIQTHLLTENEVMYWRCRWHCGCVSISSWLCLTVVFIIFLISPHSIFSFKSNFSFTKSSY